MPIMKIRGGDLDLVEYNFSPFRPGERIQTLGIRPSRPLQPTRETIRVRAPSRIHLTVLDMNRFAPERPGGGGIGFAIAMPLSADVRCIDGPDEITSERLPIIRHFLEIFRQASGYTGGFSVRTSSHSYPHVGLGSTSTMLIALAHGLNAAVGSPFTRTELRLLLGHNYVEETQDGEIAFGFETGVGPAASTYGGMAVMGDRLTLVYHHAFAENRRVFVIIPASDISSAGTKEFDLLMNRARCLDYQDRELKAYMILMDLIPALERGDLTRIGEIIWEIEFRGSKRAEIEHHTFSIYTYMSRLREAGFEFVGMSSVGPSIAVITSRTRQEVEEAIAPLGLEIAIETTVDNTGIVIERPENQTG
ncbi:MAG TPA: GHMP kinase [Methanoregulaceae archaeon]|nr:GHMP kinase [Methanoregulaceae archaeon]